MTRYIAFLRAVNVGGRIVKMEELKKIFALPGFKNISTFIQSGNVIFETNEADVEKLKKKTEAALKKALGYEVVVILKTIPEIKKILAKNPFTKNMEGMNLYVTLLSEEPEKEKIALAEELIGKGEKLFITGTTAYILCPHKTYGNSKLSNSNLERKLKVQATTRNENTLTKISELE